MTKKQYKTIEINEYGATARVYDEELSVKDAREERAENEKAAKIGQPMLFLASDFILQYANLKDEKGNVIYQEIDGKKTAVKDLDRAPFWSVFSGTREKGASVLINNATMIELLENAISAHYGADKPEDARYIESILEDVYPTTKISFGAFSLDGPRELNKEKAVLLQKSRICLYSLSLIDKDGEKVKRITPILNEDGENVGEYITYVYGSTPEDGAQIGVKGGK